ncbi:MAG TPA: C39 family peptidase [Anaerolineaceae bacterium]
MGLSSRPSRKIWLVIIAVVVLLAVVLSLPPVWSSVVYHSSEVYRTVKYWLHPPSEDVFVPSTYDNGFVATSVSAAILSDAPTPQSTTGPTAIPPQSTPKATFTPTPTSSLVNPVDILHVDKAKATFTPTPTSPPLPSSVLLRGIQCEQQHMNNCGPATLSMYLSYYDWGKDQNAVGAVVKPNSKDVNVMPYELVDFVNEHTAQHALWRYGGDLQTIKTLLAAGFPVMIEKSFEPYTLRTEGWMGHYNLVVGYDDKKQNLTVHDSYLMIFPPWGGGAIPNEQWNSFIGFDFSYSELEQAWRSFNFTFIVVYPPERENDVLNAIGPLATDKEACRIAYDRAMQETSSLTDERNKFFAWFNAGTSLVCLQDYGTAATAFDTAYGIYPHIEQNSRPYRILWYESGPYTAYYYAGRYQDVINLANQTLGNMADPVLEESYYWRALSYYALGDTTRAIADLRTSLVCHPGYAPSEAMLKQIGATP